MVFSASNNIVSRSTISRKFEEEADGSGDILELARKFMIHLTSFSIGDAFPCLKWMDYLTGFIPNLKATFAEVDEFLDQIIQERKDLETQKDFLSIMLQVRKDDGMELTGDNIKAILLVQKEVRIVVGNKPRIEAGDIHRMEYLKCVIKETLRLHPTAPFLIPRQTSTAVELSGYDIPSDVTVFINVWAIQRDPKWWDNPEEFIPERFENNGVDFKGQDFHFIHRIKLWLRSLLRLRSRTLRTLRDA
ncbi:hypothetical protein V6N11_019498 [Hibiscus sabdariffa]|uniref:Cytochrome P450 n=2 Tax=Hibiscus sabdariffa TaxID=183260 RepID=A0ABR2A7F3_9ROSI